MLNRRRREEYKKCGLCKQIPSTCTGTKKERIGYYLDSAMRMGACLGTWPNPEDREWMQELLLGEIMSITRETDPPLEDNPCKQTWIQMGRLQSRGMLVKDTSDASH